MPGYKFELSAAEMETLGEAIFILRRLTELPKIIPAEEIAINKLLTKLSRSKIPATVANVKWLHNLSKMLRKLADDIEVDKRTPQFNKVSNLLDAGYPDQEPQNKYNVLQASAYKTVRNCMKRMMDWFEKNRADYNMMAMCVSDTAYHLAVCVEMQKSNPSRAKVRNMYSNMNTGCRDEADDKIWDWAQNDPNDL